MKKLLVLGILLATIMLYAKTEVMFRGACFGDSKQTIKDREKSLTILFENEEGLCYETKLYDYKFLILYHFINDKFFMGRYKLIDRDIEDLATLNLFYKISDDLEAKYSSTASKKDMKKLIYLQDRNKYITGMQEIIYGIAYIKSLLLFNEDEDEINLVFASRGGVLEFEILYKNVFLYNEDLKKQSEKTKNEL